MPTILSRYFGVDPSELSKRGALNAHLGIDNRLFVDPNLFARLKIAEFDDARSDLKRHFASVIKLLELSQTRGDAAWCEATKRMTFREEHGAVLGYSSAGGHGRAISGDLAASLVERGKEIVDLGIRDPEIFELIGLFQEGFGSDLLSDMAIAILRDRFLAYTERVTGEVNLKPSARFRLNGKEWLLPTMPDGKRPLILVPADVLTDLPVALDRSEIDDVCALNDEVRATWNAIVTMAAKEKRDVTKSEIRRMLFANPKNLADLVRVYRDATAVSYDFGNDPEGLFSWLFLGRASADASPIQIDLKRPKNVDEVALVVRAVIAQFKKNIEENKLYEVLYRDDGKPRREVFAQRLFYAVADAYCGANDVDLSREPNAGSGPVDFKLSAGYHARILVELKKSDNPRLLHGFETQLPAYENSEASQKSIFVILRVTESEAAIRDVVALREKQVAAGRKVPEVVVIDARPRRPASKR